MKPSRLVLLSILAAGAAALPWGAAPDCGAFTASVHTDLTRDVLTDDRVTRTIDGDELTFSELAILDIESANVAEDTGPGALKPSHHVDDERIGDATSRLVDLRKDVVDALSGTFPDGFTARRRLGSALHAVQDFYSHTNWVEMGNAKIQRVLGRRALPSPSRALKVCGADHGTLLPGLRKLTSGYYDTTDPCDAAPAGKCLHGTGSCEGINKDTSGRPGFDKAHDLAFAASLDFVAQVLDADGVAGNADATRALMGRASPFAFVFDDSFSMKTELGSLKSAIGNVFGAVDALAHGDFSLGLFGPGVGTVRRTVRRDEFMGWVNALDSEGAAGDGAEPSMTALFRTVTQANQGTTLFLVTDAACADPEIAPAVAALARARHVTIVAVLTGPDAQSDSCYRTLAEGSGGVALSAAEDKAGDALVSLRARAAAGLETVFAADGTLAGAQQFVIPVECGATRLLVTATVEGNSTGQVDRPSGATVVDADADAAVTTLVNAAIVDVTSPADGNWTVKLNGAGRYSVRVETAGPVTLRDVGFALRTASAHAPLAPVAGMPAAGVPSTLTAVVGAGATDVSFLLVDEQGATIATPALAQQDPDAGSDRFVGTVTPPSQPFRVAMTAKDASGCAVRRTFPALFQTSSVGVSIEPAALAAGLTAGTTTTLDVTVVNDGAPATFDLVAADDGGRITRVEPTSLALATGASGTVQIDLAVAGTERRRSLVGLAVAAVEHGGTRANAATATIAVGDGTIALGLRKRQMRDKPAALGDSVNVSGRLVFDAESRDARIDPSRDAVRVAVGDPSNPYVLVIPAGDPGWRVTKSGTLTWKSVAGASPRGTLTIDARRRVFSLALSRFDFPATPGADARVTLRAGDDIGTATIAKR